MKPDTEIWIARDKDGTLCLYGHRPERQEDIFSVGKSLNESEYAFFDCNDLSDIIIINPRLFPEITWENSPQLLTIKINNNE